MRKLALSLLVTLAAGASLVVPISASGATMAQKHPGHHKTADPRYW